MQRTAEARGLAEKARKSDPALSAPYEVEGQLLDSDGKTEEARAAFTKAVDLGSKNYYPYYRLAVMAWQAELDADGLAAVEKLLDRGTALNPAFAPALAFLSDVKARLDRGVAALSFAQRAVVLDPGESDYRLALARVLWRLARHEEAQREANTAQTLATTEHERKNARQLLDYFAKNPPRQP